MPAQVSLSPQQIAQFKEEIKQADGELDLTKFVKVCSVAELAELYNEIPVRVKIVKYSLDYVNSTRLKPIIRESLKYLPQHVIGLHNKGVSIIDGSEEGVQFCRAIPSSIKNLILEEYFYDLNKPVDSNNIVEAFKAITSIESLILKPTLIESLNGYEKLIFDNIPANVKQLKLDGFWFLSADGQTLTNIFSGLRCTQLTIHELNAIDSEINIETIMHNSRVMLQSLKTSMVKGLVLSEITKWGQLGNSLDGTVFKRRNRERVDQILTYVPKSIVEIDYKDDNIKLNRPMSENNRLKRIFLANHKQQLKEDKQGCFGFFRNTNVRKLMPFEDIIKHAQNHNNRSRQICIKLGWMDNTGNLVNKEIKELLQPQQSGGIATPHVR
ncbi:hypothetical protein ACFORL_08590 [Legionella dresdenensis]|uniref:Uncharacterized protein n=1 Tax=Legionella dresdenensis TaxID=450200 RepID=A0ABV8CG54_9GAMM